ILGIVGLSLIAIMVLGGIFLGDSGSSNAQEYNGFRFIPHPQGQGWITSLANTQVLFQYLPSDVESISAEPFSLGQKVYVGFDPQEFPETSTEIQLVKAYLQLSGRSAPLACVRSDGCGDFPLLRSDDECVVLRSSSEAKIYKEDQCVVLQASGDFTQVIHAFVFRLFGVINHA
ncbi:MAG: hypothetical protein AABX05_05395, partial [Nanoarchaeota archaeon]